MGTYIETERLKLRDWEEKDLLPFQKMNANQQVRRYFPSLLSYRRSELDMRKMDEIFHPFFSYLTLNDGNLINLESIYVLADLHSFSEMVINPFLPNHATSNVQFQCKFPC